MKRVCIACGNRIRWFQGARMSSGLTAKFGPFHLGCWGRWLHGFHAGFARGVDEAHGSIAHWQQRHDLMKAALEQVSLASLDYLVSKEGARPEIDDLRSKLEAGGALPGSPVLGTQELSISPAATGRQDKEKT